MAEWGRTIDLSFAFAVLAGVLAGNIYNRWKRQPRVRRVVADLEYWVFLPSAALPSQDKVMETILTVSALKPPHHLLISDVRLNAALVTRDKNPTAFRPDILGEGAEHHMPLLAASRGFVRVRFLAEKLGPERRHLTYLPYLAYVYSRLGSGTLIADRAQGVVFTQQEFGDRLKGTQHPDRFADHVIVRWMPQSEGGMAQTHGMAKLGLPDLVSPTVGRDEERIVTALLEEYAEKLWDTGSLPERHEARMFEDVFVIEPAGPQRRDLVSLVMRRIQAT